MPEGLDLQVRLALEAPVLRNLIGHVYRTFNAFGLETGGRRWRGFEEFVVLRKLGRSPLVRRVLLSQFTFVNGRERS